MPISYVYLSSYVESYVMNLLWGNLKPKFEQRRPAKINRVIRLIIYSKNGTVVISEPLCQIKNFEKNPRLSLCLSSLVVI